MKRLFLLTNFLFLISYSSFTQNVGIGTATPNVSAQVDISSSSKGLLIPRMSTSLINSISNPARGLLAYDSSKNQLMVNMGTASSKNWQTIVFNSGWNLTGNSNINPASQFLGNTDNQPLRFKINNIWAGELNPSTGNVFLGLRAGQTNTTGYSNVALGTDALKLNIDRNNLIAIGDSALFNNGSGASAGSAINNTAVGAKSLYSNTGGFANTAMGYITLNSNTTGVENTAAGSEALRFNTTGADNTAVGYQSLRSATTGDYNTAIGAFALLNVTFGTANTATGEGALASTTSGDENTADGAGALRSNIAGVGNTAVGSRALRLTTNSWYNTVVGNNSGNLYDMGYNNTILGANCDVNGADYFNCVAIGQAVTCTSSSQARIGNSSTGSIGGYANWTNFSDGRYKKDVKEDVRGLDFIMKLRPVTYHLDVLGISKKLNESRGREMDEQSKKSIIEKEQIVQTGFVAQEVDQAAKEAGYDFSGVDKPKNDNDFYGLRYAEFVVPLVKAVQEQQQMIVELKKQNEDLSNLNADQKRKYEELLNRVERLASSSALRN